MKKKIRVLTLVLALLATVSLVASGMSANSVGAFRAAIPTGTDTDGRVTRILVLGCDRAVSLADSMFLVTVDEGARDATVLQIPRDTYAEYTDRSYKKLNGAPGTLGMNAFEDFLEQALDVSIDCYVTLNPDALVRIVDAIGGVELDVPADMDYADPAQGLDIHIPAGHHRLNGAQAEQFVRFRSGYANADLGRLDAQKIFLKAVAKRCKSLNAPEMLRVMLAALTTVQTDMGVQDAVRIAGVLRACDPDAVKMATLPGMAVQGVSGAWYYVVNRAGAMETVNEYLLPDQPLTEADFDRARVFDREENQLFHTVYTARKEELPYLWEKFYKDK